MPIIKWDEEGLIPDYFSEKNISYERVFIDVEYSKDTFFQKIELNDNVSFFCILDSAERCVVKTNEDFLSTHFFVPFVKCASKEHLLTNIKKVVASLGKKIPCEGRPFLRITIYKITDPDNNKYVAIGGTNAYNSKKQIIKDLKINTLRIEPKSIDPKDLWESFVCEMESPVKETYCCQVEKEEMMPFENTKHSSPKKSEDVITLLSGNDKFKYKHFDFKVYDFHKPYLSRKSETRYCFDLNKEVFDSMDDLDNNIEKMTKAFKSLTGNSSVKCHVLFSTDDYSEKITASLICYKPQKVEDEEYSA